MKFIFFVGMLVFSCTSCVSGKESRYTGSTPATSKAIRTFLNIPLSDSVDFIRWRLTLTDINYELECNYGISKPNTNGFMNGGKKTSFSGKVTREKNYYRLHHENRTLNILELNNNLLHFLDDNNAMLIGTGGWSYTINNESPVSTDVVSVVPVNMIFSDSIGLQGRTPCRGIDGRKECYKLKWWIVLYADPKTNQPNGCRVNGTMYDHNARSGIWTITNDKNGRIIYQIDARGRPSLYLLKLDENIYSFVDDKGNLLVGDHDFSYSLSRKF
jgi:hypothetical protein